MKLHLLASAGLAWATSLGGAEATGDSIGQNNVKNIAIIGAGAAGSSAAYHLQQYADQEGLRLNVTVFEKTSHIGGRSLTVDAYGNPDTPVELGASIFVEVNRILFDAARAFDLALVVPGEGGKSAGDYTAIYDGERIVYRSVEGEGWWWDVARLWWRYGTSPLAAVRLVKSTVATFLKLYEPPFFPFRSLTERAFELGLHKVTAVTGEQYLKDNGINAAFSRDIIQAATRVNYASNLAYIHGLEAMVSFATDGAHAVAGGNWRIFHNMVKRSRAAVKTNTQVSSIGIAEGSSPSAPRYIISAKDTSSAVSSSEAYPITFDTIVLASPWQFSNISTTEDVLAHKIDEIPYTKLHVTLFASPFKLRPGFFGLEDGAKAPSSVYTTLGPDEEPKVGAGGVGRTGYYSISTLRTVVNPATLKKEYVYKVFSVEALTPGFLSSLLGAEVPESFTPTAVTETADGVGGDSVGVDPISWYYPHWFYSYPLELPRVTFQDAVVGNGVYYTSGIESFISTMETSALMGKNVARLIADDLAGIVREAVKEATEGDDASGYDEL